MIDDIDAVRQLFADEADVSDDSLKLLGARIIRDSQSGSSSPRSHLQRRSAGWPATRRTQLVLAAAILTLVATVTLASLAAIRSTTSAPSRPVTGGQPDPWPRSVPVLHKSTVQVVSSGGLQISVPRAWHLDDQDCGTPLADTVLYTDGDAAVATCGVLEPAGLTVVEFQELRYLDELGWGKVAKHHLTLGGKPVLEGWLSASRQNYRMLVLSAPGLPAVLTVQSPVTALAEHLMSTARVISVDSNGCLSHVRRLEPLPEVVPSGFARPLVGGHPSTASICNYSHDWLFTSTREPKSSLASLIKVFNALPRGSDQLENGGQLRSVSNCTTEAEDFFVVRFSYPVAPPDLVYVHPNGCAPTTGPAPIPDISASNGGSSGRIDLAVISAVHDPLEFPDPDGLKPNAG